MTDQPVTERWNITQQCKFKPKSFKLEKKSILIKCLSLCSKHYFCNMFSYFEQNNKWAKINLLHIFCEQKTLWSINFHWVKRNKKNEKGNIGKPKQVMSVKKYTFLTFWSTIIYKCKTLYFPKTDSICWKCSWWLLPSNTLSIIKEDIVEIYVWLVFV